jgi:hypothetical protein
MLDFKEPAQRLGLQSVLNKDAWQSVCPAAYHRK